MIVGGCGAHFLYPETFLEFLVNIPKVYLETMPTGSLNSETLPSRAGAGWWVSLAILHRDESLWQVFQLVHSPVRPRCCIFFKPERELLKLPQCCWYRRCEPTCRFWTRAILSGLGAPATLWQGRIGDSHRELFDGLARRAIRGGQEEQAYGLVQKTRKNTTTLACEIGRAHV